MEKKQFTSLWKWLIKFILSAVAIWWITRKTDFSESFRIILNASVPGLVAAFVLYNASQLLGAVRLNTFLRDSGLRVRQSYVTKLYYRGMFYNLFLPGGIGGDGFKIYVLHKKYGTSVKTLIRAHLFDRVSGLTGLLALFFLMALFVTADEGPPWLIAATGFALLILYPVHFLLLKFIGRSFNQSFLKTSILSILLQGLQVLCIYVMLLGMGFHGSFPEYAAVFLLSSVATIIPVTLGGLGAREMTFVLLAPYTSIDPAVAVSISLLFFLVSTASSLPGIFVGKFNSPSVSAVQLNSSR